jgi:hypothetical protein
MKKFLIIVSIVFVIVAVGFGASIFLQVQTITDTEERVSTMTQELQIDTQSPGQEIIVSSVSMSKPGYIVITNIGKAETEYIGHSNLLTTGMHKNVRIALSRKVIGQTLHGELYPDNGDGVFTIAGDVEITPEPRIIGTNGLPIVDRFDVRTR